MLDKFDELIEPETVMQLFPVMDDLEFENAMARMSSIVSSNFKKRSK